VNAAEQYVAAAYLVVLVLVLTYVLIIATKLQRLERTLDDVSSTKGATPDESAPEEQTRPAASARRHRGGVEAQTR